MAKHQIKGAIYAFAHEGRVLPKLSFYDMSMPAPFFKVAEHVIEVDLPDDFDPRPGAVAALQEEQSQVRAQMTKRINELQQQINSLLAIENSADDARTVEA